MSRILVIGGHGKVALLLAPKLVGAGHEVVSVIRNPEHAAAVAATGATPRLVDVESADAAALTELVAGFDAVVWSAGAGGGDPARTLAVDRDAAIRTIDAAVSAGVSRFVMVSYFGSSRDHGVDPRDGFHAYAEAKAAADDHLRGTDLAWTVLGPSGLTLDPGRGTIDAEATTSGSVSRADVASVIAAVLEDDGTAGRTIRFNSGEVPIAEAIRDTA